MLLVVTPDSVFGLLVSAQPVVVTLFGGVASLWGPVIGAAFLVPLAKSAGRVRWATHLRGIQGVVYGAAIIVIILAAPDGLLLDHPRPLFLRRECRPRRSPRLPRPGQGRRQRRVVRHDAAAGRGTCRARSAACARSARSASPSAQGEILGIIGPNGAGKTTLFNVLNGVLPADEGTATLAGESMLGRKVHQVCRMGVGRTFQVVRSFPRLPLLDNVVVGAYGAGLLGSARPSPRRSARCIASACCIRPASPAGQLTNKQLRLMELARALAGRPRLLLLDETLAGLGREECDDVLDVLHRLRDEGMTIAHHRAHHARDDAGGRPVRRAGSWRGPGVRLAARRWWRIRSVIEAYLGKKWLARQDA